MRRERFVALFAFIFLFLLTGCEPLVPAKLGYVLEVGNKKQVWVNFDTTSGYVLETTPETNYFSVISKETKEHVLDGVLWDRAMYDSFLESVRASGVTIKKITLGNFEGFRYQVGRDAGIEDNRLLVLAEDTCAFVTGVYSDEAEQLFQKLSFEVMQ